MDESTRTASEDLQALVRSQIEQAVDFVDDTLSPTRARLARYFEGELPDIVADTGRSQAVATVVRDAVNAMKPGLLRLFFGPERVVEFRPRRADAAPLALQQTEYINYIVTEDNPGFQVIAAAIEDALVKDAGIVKWWWDDRETTQGVTYENLDIHALEAIMAAKAPDEEITIESIEPLPMFPGRIKVALTRTRKVNRAVIEAVPPWEFLFNRSARSLESASFVAHRCRKTMSDLVAMGYNEDDLDAAVSTGSDLLNNEEEIQNREWGDLWGDTDDDFLPGGEGAEPLKKIKYVEAYLLYDSDGDGIAELRKVCTVGDAYTIVWNAPADHRPFAFGMADPKAHTMDGRGIASRIDDKQAIQSVILRGTLDSLALSIVPGTEVVEGQVNMKDVLNSELGKIVRVKQPGMMREIGTSFVGKDTMPMMEFFKGEVEDATGTSRAAAGLNPDALQSSTKAAVAATVTASQQQIELIARNLAETLFKPLFRGLYRLVKLHQSEERVVKLFGQYVPVNPSSWDEADPDVTVNVALGMGMVEDRIAALQAIGIDQKEILMTMGLDNPIVTVKQYRDTLAKKAELAGWKNTDQFYQPIPPDWKPPAPQPPPPPPPDPVAMQLAQIEAEKVKGQQMLAEQKFQFEVEQAMAKMAFEREKAAMEDARARDKMIVDADVEKMKIDAQNDNKLAIAELNAIHKTATSPEAG